ncbi:MAG: hypothetical protein R8G01_17735 [Ilumatobacteraceae bacterium]|nr:hypothetical protein [Ilumatobacteraceae bacterium]
MQRVEFTIEPFNEGEPGEHVTAPAAALRATGLDIEVGPFGSACVVEDDRAGEVVATVVGIALQHGATHINVDVAAG